MAIISDGEPSASGSSSSSSGTSDQDGWLDVDPGEEQLPKIVSLLDSDVVFDDAQSMLDSLRANHGFDFLRTCQTLRLDFYGAVKLVNFVRGCARADTALPSPIEWHHVQDDANLQPVLADDGFLMSLDDVLAQVEIDNDTQEEQQKEAPTAAHGPASDDVRVLQTTNRELRDQLHLAETRLADYRLAVAECLDSRWGRAEDGAHGPPQLSKAGPGTEDSYWQSYAANDIHETMLKDKIRTDAYRDFIYLHKELFRGKTVLDVGCGTGILSMFCAKAGAAKVLAVDKSDIIQKAVLNVFHNGLADTITCISGAIEEVTLPVARVDVIVSEWMGYGLLFEAMLPSVLWARDRYLAPDGLMVPSHAVLWIAPCSDPDYVTDNFDFWRDVYSFDMKAMQEGIYDEARVTTISPESLGGTAHPFLTLDLYTSQAKELSFTAPWSSQLLHNPKDKPIDGFLIWFDILFATTRPSSSINVETGAEAWAKKNGSIAFTTGPHGPETHWRQCFLVMDSEQAPTSSDAGTDMTGEISYSILSTDRRGLSIRLKWQLSGGPRCQTWKLP